MLILAFVLCIGFIAALLFSSRKELWGRDRFSDDDDDYQPPVVKTISEWMAEWPIPTSRIWSWSVKGFEDLDKPITRDCFILWYSKASSLKDYLNSKRI